MGILQARILEWVAIPFSRGSSWPRDWTCASCIAGGFFTIWACRVLRRARYKSSCASSDKCEMEWEVPTALYDEASPGYHPLTLQTVLFIFLNQQDWDRVFPYDAPYNETQKHPTWYLRRAASINSETNLLALFPPCGDASPPIVSLFFENSKSKKTNKNYFLLSSDRLKKKIK